MAKTKSKAPAPNPTPWIFRKGSKTLHLSSEDIAILLRSMLAQNLLAVHQGAYLKPLEIHSHDDGIVIWLD